MAGPLFVAGPRGIRVTVRLTPRAGRNAVTGRAAGADGTPLLKAAVTAVPERGAANEALIALLAKAWRLPKTALTIVGGATDRTKLIGIDGDAALAARLEAWAETLPAKD
ncbi:DUF167 family protein [Inquilinus limosus]|uniref:UPF0235 protein BWR60_17000 n=1 Tax=Inquilinus limosus TaxID=171674 RepID=A0A211ZKX3_9PROT|nr:DUF167 family protein [Inquilinus limosus]OWJ65922.1 hypothetical protein BWR60_17000 [Inquilinus limosus]